MLLVVSISVVLATVTYSVGKRHGLEIGEADRADRVSALLANDIARDIKLLRMLRVGDALQATQELEQLVTIRVLGFRDYQPGFDGKNSPIVVGAMEAVLDYTREYGPVLGEPEDGFRPKDVEAVVKRYIE